MSFRREAYVIVWDDSVQHSDGSGKARHIPARQVRIGWMIEHDEHGITVASEYNNDDDTWRDEHFIPCGMIVSITHLTDP